MRAADVAIDIFRGSYRFSNESIEFLFAVLSVLFGGYFFAFLGIIWQHLDAVSHSSIAKAAGIDVMLLSMKKT